VTPTFYRTEQPRTRPSRTLHPFVNTILTTARRRVLGPLLGVGTHHKSYQVPSADPRIHHLEEELERVNGLLEISRSQRAHSDAEWGEKRAQWVAERQEYRQRLEESTKSLADSKEKEKRAVARTRELSEEITGLTSELHDAHTQHASLRDHLQLRDSREPKAIVTDFALIQRQIGKLCYNLTNTITEHILASFPDIQTSDRAMHFEALNKFLGSYSTLALSSSGVGRPLEDFVDCAFCVFFNDMLYRQLLRCFHPMLDSEGEKLIQQIYRDVRAAEPQIVSAKWRSAAFKSIELTVSPTDDTKWAHEFASSFANDIAVPLVQSICGYWVNEMLPKKLFDAVVDIALKARIWHRDIQSNFLALDFQPILVAPMTQFSSEYMNLHKKHRLSASHPSPNDVLASVEIGIFSSESFGTKRDMEVELQVKVGVLTEGFFEQQM